MIEVQNVSHRYGERVALESVSFTLARGKMLALLGPNGSGKSTLFRLLSTLTTPQSGRVVLDGHDAATDAAAVRRKLGVVFQSPAVDHQLTVAENVACHAALFGLARSEYVRRADELLARLGVADRKSDRVKGLSGGLRRRVELAKALVTSPTILLLDEPSAGLDIDGRRQLRELLRELRAEGLTIVLTTHQIDEAEIADEVAILDRGRLVALDTPSAIRGSDSLFRLESDDVAELRRRLSLAGFEAIDSNGAIVVRTADAAKLLAELSGDSHALVRRLDFGPPGLDVGYLALTGRSLTPSATA